MESDGNTRVAEFVCRQAWHDLPASVQDAARLCLLEALGAALAGSGLPSSRFAAQTAAHLWRGNQATIWWQGLRAQAVGAAFANACAVDASEGDKESWLSIVPAAWVVGESVNAGGRALLEALAIGVEVALRARRCWQVEQPFEQAGGTWASIGCAAAAARLYRLNVEQAQHALGIADYHAPNAPQPLEPHALSMVNQAGGWGALNGVMAAELAQRGFTGIPSLMGAEAYRQWVLDIGQRYWITAERYSGAAGRWEPGQVVERFRRRARQALAEEHIQQMIERVRCFESLDSVQAFIERWR